MHVRSEEFEEQEKRIKAWMAKVKHKIVVLSGKGGVGKSTVAANLAMALAWKGHPNQVGVLDADITGPSIPKILGVRKQQLNIGPAGVFPAIGALGIKVISMDFFLPDDDTPVIWRGPLKSMAIRQFLADIVWGDLDYLVVDLPPGTGDEALSVMQHIPDIDGVIIVTIPSEVSQIVVKKAVTFTRKLNAPLIGVLENMSGFICPKCGAVIDIFMAGGGEKIANDLHLPFLGRIPLDPRICEDSDRGLPFIVEHSDSPAAKAFMTIVDSIEEFLKKRE
ncbi:MAG: Mrp/NBP35 family ATP-binding protein [Nitrososphaerales archaeon]